MAESLSRELILPARRLGVPPRPSDRQLAVLAERSAEQWSISPRDWGTQQVVRLAVAAVLAAQAERSEVDLATTSLADAARLFRPHVGLSTQAFRLAVVEAVNAGVPAAADPLRDALRRLGVTGREPLVMVDLGLDRVPGDGAEFWKQARHSSTVTAVVDGVATGQHRSDLSRLDRRQLGRADALVLAGGKVTAVAIGSTPQPGGSWVDVPIALTRPHRRSRDEQRGKKGGKGAPEPREIVLRGEGWTEVFEIALDALGVAMHQLDTGQRPRGRSSTSIDALAHRLVAARKRTVADVVASLRAIDPMVLEMFDHQVDVTDVRVAVPVLDDDEFGRLWLSPEALAGPLILGSADLFFGGRVETRGPAGPGGRGGQERRGRGDQSGQQGGQSRRGRRGRGPKPKAEQPGAAAPDAEPSTGPAPEHPAATPPPEVEQATPTPPEAEHPAATPPEVEQAAPTPPEVEQSTATPPEVEQASASER
ncbi:hypothetical protein [Nocardioides sp. GXZ039]|uniref:hypothetical protein n=1 Tax=Nocardioides sp. GXZ039 TaxID=3136018 RepID=UPI0030F3ED2E